MMSIESEFKPDLTPKEMLELGIFNGNYFSNEESNEFPEEWFENARVTKNDQPDPTLNFFEISASQPLAVWQAKGWINPVDPKGWFQWYCRYHQGRRLPDEDIRQIKRWKAMRRHVAQVQQGCHPGDLTCRQKQRQALLHWAYDSRKI